MSLLLKKLNQASEQKAADDTADKSAASQPEGAPASADVAGLKPPAPATAPAPATPAAQPATPAQPAPAPVSAGIQTSAQTPASPAPTLAKPAPAAPAPVALKSAPPVATPAPAATPALAATPAPAGVKPQATPASAPASAPAAPPPTADVHLETAATAYADAVGKGPQVKPRARDLPAGLRAAGDRARGGIASAARVLSAQAGDSGSKMPKILGTIAGVLVVIVGGFYAYSTLFSSLDIGVSFGNRQTSQEVAASGGENAVTALPSPAVDVQAQVIATNLPQVDDSVVLTVSGEDAIADYEVVPDVAYSDEEWSLIEREEREAAEEEERSIAVIAASEPIGVEAVLDIENADVPDDNISVRADNVAKVANRAEIQSSRQAVRRAAKLSQAADLYAAGRYERAGRVYGEVLSDAPANLQALRGSALAETALRRYQSAADFYVRILEHFPDDPFAVAELSNLGGINPVEVERLLKNLLGKTPPTDGRLYFALGNVYAASSRWHEARDAFGDALSREKNPDYAYNLAVALEYLRKPELAVRYYRQALQMAQGAATAGFDADEVRSRIAVLDA